MRVVRLDPQLPGQSRQGLGLRVRSHPQNRQDHQARGLQPGRTFNVREQHRFGAPQETPGLQQNYRGNRNGGIWGRVGGWKIGNSLWIWRARVQIERRTAAVL